MSCRVGTFNSIKLILLDQSKFGSVLSLVYNGIGP